MKPLLSAALILAFATSGWSQQTDTAVFRVGEIVVQATRPLTTTGGASAVELKLDSLRMQAAPTLEQLLRRVPLVQVRVNSRGESQFSLRGSGSDARQVSVIVDGIPLNLGWDHRADLSVLPATAAQTLTIARGLPSLLYGPNVLGGVVEIGVAQGGIDVDAARARVDASVDHTGATGLATSLMLPIAARSASWLVRAGGGYRQRGDLPITSGDLLANTDLDHIDGFASLSYRRNSGYWGNASVSAYAAERGIAAEQHISSPRYWRYPIARRVFGVIAGGTGVRASPFGGIGDIELSLGIDAGQTAIDQFDDATYTDVSAQEDSEDRNFTLRMRADQTLTRQGELRAAFTYADINHDERLNPGIAASYRQQLWSSGLELHWHASRLGAGTRFTIGGTIDGAATPESGDKPRLDALNAWGARAGFTSALNARLLLHGGASTRSRFPALRELYSGALGRFEPNPALRAEQLVALEGGASLHGKTGELQMVAFHHVLKDAIVRLALPNARFQRSNRDRQSGSGVEVLAGWRAGLFSLSGDAVLQRTRLTDPAAATSLRPEYQPGLIAGMGIAGPLPWQARFDVRGRHTGSQYCINPESGADIELAAARRYDAELSRRWRKRGYLASELELAIAADNVTDKLSYDQCGLPQPGRTLRVQLRLR